MGEDLKELQNLGFQIQSIESMQLFVSPFQAASWPDGSFVFFFRRGRVGAWTEPNPIPPHYWPPFYWHLAIFRNLQQEEKQKKRTYSDHPQRECKERTAQH